MKTYKLYNSMGQQFVVDVDRNAFIPFAEGNTDYQAYLAWCALGNTPLPADDTGA